MSIRSEAMKDGKAVEQAHVSGMWPASVAMFIVGGLLWLAGAKYTLFGWVAGINWFLAWLDLPARVPTPTGYYVLLMIPIGLLYSAIEIKRPWQYHSKSYEKIALYAAIWGLLVISDIGSTVAGVRNPGPAAWTITRQIAASWLLAGSWSLILTFVPEWLITGAVKLLRR